MPKVTSLNIQTATIAVEYQKRGRPAIFAILEVRALATDNLKRYREG
jgi:hypothetical protein